MKKKKMRKKKARGFHMHKMKSMQIPFSFTKRMSMNFKTKRNLKKNHRKKKFRKSEVLFKFKKSFQRVNYSKRRIGNLSRGSRSFRKGISKVSEKQNHSRFYQDLMNSISIEVSPIYTKNMQQVSGDQGHLIYGSDSSIKLKQKITFKKKRQKKKAVKGTKKRRKRVDVTKIIFPKKFKTLKHQPSIYEKLRGISRKKRMRSIQRSLLDQSYRYRKHKLKVIKNIK